MSEKSIYQKIGDAVADYAPGIATILAATGVGVPLAGAVGAIGALTKAFGLGSDAKPEDILTAISADPEIKLKAMIANNDFVLKQRDQELEELRLELADVNSARDREKSVKDNVNRNLAYAIILSFIAVVGFTLGGWVKVESVLAGTLIGYLSAKAEQVLSYYFGSSRGSAQKTDLLAKAQPIK